MTPLLIDSEPPTLAVVTLELSVPPATVTAPEPKALLFPATTEPALTSSPPENELLFALRFSVPFPIFSNCEDPLIVPETISFPVVPATLTELGAETLIVPCHVETSPLVVLRVPFVFAPLRTRLWDVPP